MNKHLSNRAWDFLKWFCAFGLHALGVAYGQLGVLWNLPFINEITKSLDIVGTLLAAFLMWENYQYKQDFEIFSAPKVQPSEPDFSPIETTETVHIEASEVE